MLIILDDIAIPFGAIRIRKKGSDGGHNGLKNINEILGHNTYARMRFGVGGDFPKGMQIDYVLGKWSGDEISSLAERVKIANQGILDFTTIGVDRAMNTYNKK